MNGPAHYKEAERYVRYAEDDALDGQGYANAIAAAQVHATLALAAATAEKWAQKWSADDDDLTIARTWSEAIS